MSKPVMRTRRPMHRWRDYPVLRFVILALYILAALNVAWGLLSIVAVITSAAALPTDAGLPIVVVTSCFMLMLIAGAGAIGCCATAECIRVLLDIQRNTEETAVNSRS